MSFKGTIALAGVSLIALGVRAEFGLAVASIAVGAILLSAALVDAWIETRNRGSRP